MARRVTVVTTTRAEFGILRPLLEQLAADTRCELEVVATGMHFAGSRGGDIGELRGGGLPEPIVMDVGMSDSDPMTLASACGDLTRRLTTHFTDGRPELAVVLGDRFELLSVAQACLLSGVPLVHLHGGEITEGAFDDSVRHAITKLAALHFVATEDFAERVLQLGEEPWRVHVTGALSLATSPPSIKTADLSRSVGLDLEHGFFLVTVHPETVGRTGPEQLMQTVIDALSRFADSAVIVTAPNLDPGADAILARIQQWANDEPGRIVFIPSLGYHRYSAALRLATAVIGNSSSGIIEAPSVGTPTVNVGERQAGRPRAASVIDVDSDVEAVVDGIERARTLKAQASGVGFENPYYRVGSVETIIDVLMTVPTERLSSKRFVDRR